MKKATMHKGIQFDTKSALHSVLRILALLFLFCLPDARGAEIKTLRVTSLTQQGITWILILYQQTNDV